MSKKRHISHNRLKSRAVSFCPMYHFAPVSPNLLFECNISENDIFKFTQNIFLKDVLSAWCKCRANAVISSYRHEILWNNSHIKAGANTIMFANWYHNGIKFF